MASVPQAAAATDVGFDDRRWDEETFGLEYDLDLFNIVAVSHQFIE